MGRCCVGSVARCGDGRGVWEGSVGRCRGGEEKCGEDVSICEERCGSVEKCCVGGVGKRGKTKKWSYMFHKLSPSFAPISLFFPWCLSFAPKEAISPTLRTAALQYRYSSTYGCCTEI